MTPCRTGSRRLATLRLPLSDFYDPLIANAALRCAPLHPATELETKHPCGQDQAGVAARARARTKHL